MNQQELMRQAVLALNRFRRVPDYPRPKPQLANKGAALRYRARMPSVSLAEWQLFIEATQIYGRQWIPVAQHCHHTTLKRTRRMAVAYFGTSRQQQQQH